MSDLVRNPEDQFSQNEAQFIVSVQKFRTFTVVKPLGYPALKMDLLCGILSPENVIECGMPPVSIGVGRLLDILPGGDELSSGA